MTDPFDNRNPLSRPQADRGHDGRRGKFVAPGTRNCDSASTRRYAAVLAGLLGAAPLATGADKHDFSPRPDEQQVPRAMHSRMKDRPAITVGLHDGDIRGADNRALQAAMDYVAGLGGGTVEIGEGEFTMHDSLHLRSFVTVRGTRGKTILRKAKAASSPLALDGDYGEEQITVVNPEGFQVGHGVAIWDSHSGGFHTTVARITGQQGNTFSIDTPLNADCMAANKAQAATVFPVVSGYNLEGARVENLIIDGNKEQNVYLDGCRGGGIFLYRGFGTVIENCVVRNYHGDGISFQQSNDVLVQGCVSEDNSGLGLHPGSGSQRPVVRECIARRNGEDGLYLCWRVRHGLFEKNILENNGRFGISIGHKDSDNLLENNQIRSNQQDGVYFRNETEGMAGHRNRLEKNLIENNGVKSEAAGIRVRGETRGLVFKNNLIRDTRASEARKQTTGIRIEEPAGEVILEGNEIEAKTRVDDQRKGRP
jgi:parallel beta-helix repeat protein